ncbi:MAG: OmpA family protein, partial [Saprospiraceae bacterium]|nr:OmpA family protein [Saprospiraceae bacterium]
FRDSMSYYGYYATDGMSISADGKLFLVAAGADYQGNLDIYISRKDERGNWSYPKRLAISTVNDERSVFIAGDGKTIYFGSDGRGGAGKLDIFKATLQPNDVCSGIINIGAPFNTPDDDYGFIIGVLGTDAYFVRNDDIYYARLGTTDSSIKPQRTIVINGTVKDCDGRNTQSLVELYNTSTNERLATARSNAVTGEYSLAFPYAAGIYLQRFILQNDQSIIRKQLEIDNATTNLLTFEISPDCDESPAIASLLTPVVAMIYFEFDHFDLTDFSKKYLDSLTSQLDTNYRYQVQLIGHTDSVGSNAYNMELSEKRVKTVAHYFLQFEPKINAEIAYKGETLPFLPNTNAQNRAQNRRVEIKIVPIQSDSIRLKQ